MGLSREISLVVDLADPVGCSTFLGVLRRILRWLFTEGHAVVLELGDRDPGTLGTLRVETKRVFLHGMVLAGNVDLGVGEHGFMVIQTFRMSLLVFTKMFCPFQVKE